MFADGSVLWTLRKLCGGTRGKEDGLSASQKEALRFLTDSTFIYGHQCAVTEMRRKATIRCSGRLSQVRPNYATTEGIPSGFFFTGTCDTCKAISFTETMTPTANV